MKLDISQIAEFRDKPLHLSLPWKFAINRKEQPELPLRNSANAAIPTQLVEDEVQAASRMRQAAVEHGLCAPCDTRRLGFVIDSGSGL
jgi:hypothetical protein